MFGWRGRLLRVNLTSGAITKELLEHSVAQSYLGGRGLGTYLHANEVPAATAPLSAGNHLIFVTAPLTGTLAPNGGRYTIVAKTPPDGEIAAASISGGWGPELKFAGFDGIIFEGKAENPVYLWINNGQAELRAAKHLWRAPVGETTETLLRETDEKAVVACIGPAGTNGVGCSVVVSDYWSAAGAGGLGAVMGAKNLKAVAVCGMEGFRMARPKQFMKLALQLRAHLAQRSIAAQGAVLRDSILVAKKVTWVPNPAGSKPARPHGCFGCATALSSFAAKGGESPIALSEATSLEESNERLAQNRAFLDVGLDYAAAKAVSDAYQPAPEDDRTELARKLAHGDLPAESADDGQSMHSKAAVDRGPCIAGGYAVVPAMAAKDGDEDLLAALDSAGLCPFLAGAVGAETIAELLTAATGVAFSPNEVKQAGQRISALTRTESAVGASGG